MRGAKTDKVVRNHIVENLNKKYFNILKPKIAQFQIRLNQSKDCMSIFNRSNVKKRNVSLTSSAIIFHLRLREQPIDRNYFVREEKL